MTSWLIDLVLIAALAYTAWRTSVMVKQLRALRTENSEFRRMLADADKAIDRAAHAVVSFNGEGLATLHALERQSAEARRQADRLEHAIRSADLIHALNEHSARRAVAA